jgi:hypothetical protein
MSGLTTGELVGLFDPITKAAIGVIDAGGKEQIGLGGTAVGDATGAAKGILQFGGALLGSTSTSQTVLGTTTAVGLESALAAVRTGGVGTLISLMTSQFGLSVPTSNNAITYTNIGIQSPSTAGSGAVVTSDSDGTTGYSLLRRVRWPTVAATTTNQCGWSRSVPLFRMGSVGDTNGSFPVLLVTAISDTTPTQGSFFLGLANGIVANTNSTEPSTFTAAHIALAKNSTDTNLSIQYNNTGGTAIRIALGATFALAQYKAFGLYIDKNAGGTQIYVTPLYLDPATDLWVKGSVQTLTTNIPTSAATSLGAICIRSSLAVSLALSVDDVGMWRGAFAAAAGGGSSTLAALTDVTFGSPTNGQVLSFDTASGKTLFSTPSGSIATNWQTVTPNVNGTTPVALNWASGPNIKITAIPGAAQPVSVIQNVPDGADFQINLDNGGLSGLWTTYSTGAPTTAGYVWMGGGGAVATTGDALLTIPIFGKRDGFVYYVQAGYPVPKP